MKRFYQVLVLALLLLLVSSTSFAQATFQIQVQSRLSLRQGPGTNFARLLVMDVGTIVTVSARDNSNTWIFGTTASGATGWMALRYTSITTSQVFALPVSGANAPVPAAPAPTTPAPAAPVPVANPAPANAIVAIANANVNLRSGPSTANRRVGLVLSGSQFLVSGRDATNNWAFGSYNGLTGWVSVQFFSVNPNAYLALPVTNDSGGVVVSVPVPVAPAPTNPVPVANPAPAPAGGIVAIATNNVNLRSGPSTSNGRVGLVLFNTQFIMTGRNSAGTWAFGNYNGISGWASATYFTFDRNAYNALPVTNGNGAAPAPVPPAPQPVAPPAPVVTAPVTGFAYGGHILNFNGGIASYLRAARMTWVKKQVRYSRGQNPADLAGLINQIQSNGFRVMLGVVGSASDVTQPGYFDDYAGYVAGLVASGADAIEVWNEPNIDREWAAGSISPSLYTDMLRRSYNAIKAVNPNALVISGAPAPTGFYAGCSGAGCDDAPFLQGMVAAGALSVMDCVGIHYNEGAVSPLQTTGDPRNPFYTRYYRGMVDTYNTIVGFQRPLCFTELGYLSSEGYPPLPPGFEFGATTSVAEQAQWLDQAVALAPNDNVRLLIVWNVDFQSYGADPQAGYAIIRPDGSCPACNALAN